jgi:hypothetical protein
VLTNRILMLGSAALAAVSFMALDPAEAQAGGWSVHVEARPVVVVQPYYPPPPPPRWRYVPAPVYVPAAPVVVAAPVFGGPSPPVGLAVSGLVQARDGEHSATGGFGLTAQYRTSPHTLMLAEFQWLGSPRGADGFRREDMAGLLGFRLFPWDAPIAPYFELAGGFGESTFFCCAQELHTSQLVGRYGVGLELRLGPHWFLEGQLAQIHRFNFEADDPTLTSRSERAVELHGGLGVRF